MRVGFIVCVGFLIVCLSAALFAAPPNHRPEGEVCNPSADYFLGNEDYPEAIRVHLEVLRHDPGNALAHYHLGFAYGMVGRAGDEIYEYGRAVALGLRSFDLFVNLGLARFESGDLIGASEALRTACNLTDSPEPHFDLGLIYERRGMLSEAESEILRVLASEPNQPDYLNTLAVIKAERGDTARARDIWLSILSRHPHYHPALANLRILNTFCHSDVEPCGAADQQFVKRRPAVRFCQCRRFSRAFSVGWLLTRFRRRSQESTNDGGVGVGWVQT